MSDSNISHRHPSPRPKAQSPGPLIAMALLLSCLFSTTSLAQTTWPDLGKAVETQADGSKDAALLVGIEDYTFAPDIPGAVSNISAWYLHLRKTKGLPLDHIKLLRNNQATREEILKGMDAVLAKVQPGGTLWVVFIGHGAPSSKGEGLLIGVDAQQKASSVASRGVGQRELLQRIQGGKQAQAVVLLDACFSGLDQSGQALVKGVQPMVPVRPEAAPDKTLVLTAARSNQFAGALPGAKRPAFSYLMLGAIRGWADKDKNGLVEASEAFEYTRQALDVLVTDHRQQPRLFGDARGVEFSQGAREAGPDLDEMRLALATAPVEIPERVPDRPERVEEVRPMRYNTRVRIEAIHRNDSFEAVVVGSGGKRFVCEQEVTIDTPCTLRGVTPGPATVHVNGDIDESKRIVVPIGATKVKLLDIPYTGLAIGIPGIVASFGGFVSMLVVGLVKDSGFLVGAGIATGVVGLGISIPAVAYTGYLSTLNDHEEITSTSIPDTRGHLHPAPTQRAPVQFGLAPLDGGAMLSLGFQWD